MASQLEPNPDTLDRAKNRLRHLIQWRDHLAREVAFVEAEIGRDARDFATLNGDLVKPTLPQLRRMLFEERASP